MSKMKAIIAGGGTGGHIFPAVAIGHAIMHHFPGAKVLFVGAIGKMEMEKVPKEGFKIIGLDIAGFDRGNLLKNILLPFKLLKSRMKALKIIKNFQPNVVVGVGGYASFPMLHAAQGKGIPTLIQEQNSYAGKSNKILGKRANSICVAYENMERFFPKEKIAFTGNPVRQLILQSHKSNNDGKKAFKLAEDKKTLLIVGGSLGALAINKAIAEGLDRLRDLQIIWQTGKPFYEEAKQLAQKYNNIIVKDFITNMDDAYAAADIIVSRAGAMAISELCIVGKPVIFVPYPFAAEDHQTSNALSLVNKNAAKMVANDDAKDVLVEEILKLYHNEEEAKTLSKNIQSSAIRNATDRIINEIKTITQLK